MQVTEELETIVQVQTKRQVEIEEKKTEEKRLVALVKQRRDELIQHLEGKTPLETKLDSLKRDYESVDDKKASHAHKAQ